MPQSSISPQACAELLVAAKSIVALTGAGISTAAGIPDFRGPNGLYVTRRYDPLRVFELDHFLCEPRYFYEFSSDFIAETKTVQPTFSHLFLAELEQQGRLSGVITQNIDLLHQQAGSSAIIELHGSYASATCVGCGKQFAGLTGDWWEQQMRDSASSPVVYCPCGDLLKPDIVFFGEAVKGYQQAEELIAECDLLLVLGSSLEVSPASYLPQSTTATTLIVAKGNIALAASDNRYFISEDLDDFLKSVATERLRLL